MSSITARQDQSASLKSEKTKDIRATNIIAAKGKPFFFVLTII
jgi:hypothetical protein